MSNPQRPFGCNLPLAVALLGVVFAGEARGAQLRAVQTGTTTLLGGSASVTATLSPAVDGTKAFLVFGVSESTSNPGDGQVTGQITNCTPTCNTVTFARSGTTGAITVKWYVAEFASGVSVQRGSVSLPPGPPSDTPVPIASVNLARSFPLVTLRTAGGLYDSGDFIRAKLTSSTNLQIFDPEGGAGLPVAEWQVVEYTDASVQTGDLSLTFSQTSQTATLAPAVNTSKSWLIFGYECTPAPCQSDQPNIGAKLFRGRVTNSTTLTFDRSNASAAPAEIVNLTWYLVEFTDNTRVLNGSEPFAAAEGQRKVVIPPVTHDQSIAAGGGYARGGVSPYNLDDNAGVAWFTLDLRSPRDLVLSRGATPAGANLGWYVIEFLTTRYRSIGTAGAYNTGNVTANNGSEVVMGSGTSWTTANRGRGDRITIPCPDPPTCTGGTNYTIFSVDSPTQLILTSVFTGTSGLQSYNITRKFATPQAWEDCVSGAALDPLCEGVTGGSLLADQRREVGIAYKDSVFLKLGAPPIVTIDGSTTDATHTITLTADSGNRHLGLRGNGVILDMNGGTSTDGVQVNDEFVTVEWLEIRNNGDLGADGIEVGLLNPPNQIVVRHNLLHNLTYGLQLQDNDVNLDAFDNIIHDNARNIVLELLLVGSPVVRIFNNTVFRAGSAGVAGIGTLIAGSYPSVVLRNNVSHSNAVGDYGVSGLDPASSNNLAGDATGITHSPAGGGFDSVPLSGAGGVNFVSTPLGSENLHIQGTSQAVNTGVDLSAVFQTDIDGVVRLLPWEIGADDTSQTTAVTLQSFSAAGADGAVDLSWTTASEISNLGFHLYRSLSAASPWERITSSLIPGLGSSPTGASYAWRDGGLSNGTTYFYLLEDVETTGRTERHGPASATPQPGSEAGAGGSGGFGESDKGGGSSSGSGRITYGDPSSSSLRSIERGKDYVVLELLTPGFVATPEDDGTVRISIPGFVDTTSPGQLAVPVRRALVDALAGRRVRLASVSAEDVVNFDSFRLAAASAPEVVVTARGVVRTGSSPRRLLPSSRGIGLAPRRWARLLPGLFQGETKKAQVELAPLRHDSISGRTVLARRLVVRVEFVGTDSSERSLGGSRGRKPPTPTLPRQGVFAQLVVRAPGLYRLRFEDLYGSARRGLNAGSLRLSHLGQAVPYHLEPDRALFAPGSSLFFLVKDDPSLHDRGEAVHELGLGQRASRMGVISGGPSGPQTTEYVHTLTLEQNRFYQSALLEAPDLWLWDLLVSPVTKSYSFTLDSLSSSSTSSHLRVVLQGASDFEEVDHHVRVFLNGIPVGETTWDGRVEQVFETDLTPGILVEGTNTLALENVGDAGAAYSMVFLNRFEVSHPRWLTLSGGRLEGRFEQSGRAEIQGLGTPQTAFVVDKTAAPIWLRSPEVTPTGLAFRAEVDKSYLAVSDSSVLAPEIRKRIPTSLRKASNRATWILIGPREFLPAARPLLDLRRSQGLLAKSVALEDVYSEFGFGEPSAKAIHDFLSFAFHNWRTPPRYVVLLGDATYDPRDYLKTGVKDRVPTPIVETTYLWTASDPSLAAVNGEDAIPDLAIGRLSAGTLEEAQRLVTKLLAFEQAGRTFDGKAILVADNADLAGNFEQNQDEIAASVLQGRETEKLYLRDLGSSLRSEILAAFDNGPGIVSYVGHGATAVWASENVLNNLDVASLQPQAQQPLLLTLNCLNGFFHFPPLDSLAEALVKAEGKGALAAFSPSGLSVNDAAHLFHRALLSQIESGAHTRLGDAVLAAQQDYANQGAMPDLLSIYHLLGDPAMKIK